MPDQCVALHCRPPAWMRGVLLAAGAYNLLFGFWAVFYPAAWFRWSGMDEPRYLMLWQCIGMIVGVYGLGYLIAATNAIRHWPIVLVGFLGKLFGPFGFAYAIHSGQIPLAAAWITLTNDLLWLIPFALILWATVQAWAGRPPSRETPLSIEEASKLYKLGSGESLADASRKQTLVLVFLRHFGCTFTRQILSHLQELEAEATTHGGRLVLVHMLDRGDEAKYVPSGKVARIADPFCELYRAFGLGKAGFWELFGPTVWIKGCRSFFSGCGVGHLAGDGLQMPGAFLFRDARILVARPAKNAAELPEIQKLFEGLPA